MAQSRNPSTSEIQFWEEENPYSNSEITRLLAAGAITQGSTYRKHVVAHYHFPFQAASPELGFDPEIVLRVCNHIEIESRTSVWPWIITLVIGTIFSAGFLFVPILVIWGWRSSSRHERIRKKYIPYFRKGAYNPAVIKQVFTRYTPPSNMPRLNQNVAIYGGFRPFVGAGLSLGGWSFPIDIGEFDAPMSGARVMPTSFEVSELYDAVTTHLQGLRFDNVSYRDYLYAHGSDIRRYKDLLKAPLSEPQQIVDPNLIRRYMNSSEWGVRHYKWITVEDWGGEMTLSFFLRFSKRGSRNLFVEFNVFLLPPLRASFKSVDRVVENRLERLARAASQRQAAFANNLNPAFAALLNNAKKALKELREEITGNPNYNYGVDESIREYAATNGYTRFFQQMDKEMYTKIFEKEILRSILAFLKAHGVNTTEFEEQQSYIVNQGIMVQGNVSGEGIAIGNNAQASNQKGSGNPMNAAMDFMTNRTATKS